MTAHNNHLTQQLTQAIAGLGTATDNIVTLQSQLNALTYNGGGGYGGSVGGNRHTGTGTSGGNSSANAPNNKKNHRFDFNREPKRKVYNNNNYCYTHGYHITDSHTSTTCINPGAEHKKDATRANSMGGCTRGASVCL